MRRRGWWFVLLSVCACDANSQSDLSWSVRFANPETASRASQVRVAIVSGDCSSKDVVYASTVTRDREADGAPKLAKGQYALLGTALTEECLLVASACQPLSVPVEGESVELVLADVPASQFCGDFCADRCGGGPDGGRVTDASMVEVEDASALDASPSDGGRDAALSDASLPCDAIEGPDGRCYRPEESALSFADAESACVGWGGHLVSFNDAEEELWVSQQFPFLSDAGTGLEFWIGFTDSATEAQWVWTDGSTEQSSVTSFVNDAGKTQYKTASDTPYTHWGPNLQTIGNGQPNNGSGPKDAPPPEGHDCALAKGAKLSGPGGIAPRPEWDDRNCADLHVSICERP